MKVIWRLRARRGWSGKRVLCAERGSNAACEEEEETENSPSHLFHPPSRRRRQTAENGRLVSAPDPMKAMETLVLHFLPLHLGNESENAEDVGGEEEGDEGGTG